MNVESLLAESGEARTSLLIIEDRGPKEIVVGVPHHAPMGTKKLPCPQHEVSDENAGYLGRQLAEDLNCCSIIACNYTMDVNKLPHSDYFMQIATWKPAVLVEIHGHKGTKEIGGNAYYHIEISSGSTSNQQSKKLAERIKEVWNDDPELKEFSISGDYDAIHFTASKSVTINGAPWLAYHIELPPALRIQEGTEKPPEVGYRFCKILENVLKEFHLRNAP